MNISPPAITLVFIPEDSPYYYYYYYDSQEYIEQSVAFATGGVKGKDTSKVSTAGEARKNIIIIVKMDLIWLHVRW